jgi:anthranilate synthase/aminodeoxychorismate synthase-like glutamine amidotransferase
MKVLVVDNYDSFTFNLVQLLGMKNVKVKVVRNDEISIDEIKKIDPDKILISPGPGRPENAGISHNIIENFGDDIAILGVCLGHQLIAYAFGGKIVQANKLMHGKTSTILHDTKTIFNGIPQKFSATRYHSLIVDRNSVPEDLEISAETEDSIIMGLRHKHKSIEGIQFHPESILTEIGAHLIDNWLKL